MHRRFRYGIVALAAVLAATATMPATRAADVVTEWNNVKAPPAPELKPVTADPKTNALLMLDIIKQLCNAQRFGHCAGTVPKVKKLLDAARAAGALVVYTATLTPSAAKADVLPEVAPIANEPFVRGNIDKFYNTDLEKILKNKGVKTVITVGGPPRALSSTPPATPRREVSTSSFRSTAYRRKITIMNNIPYGSSATRRCSRTEPR